MGNTTEIKFGTSGWRGIISKDFTVENLILATQAIADYLKKTKQAKQGIIVGYDTRFMSDKFAKISADILSQNNIPALVTDRDTPTPVIAFGIIRRRTAGAINITASHNPPEYNGIKFSTAYGGPAPAEVTKQIERGIKTAKFSRIKYIRGKPRSILLREELIALSSPQQAAGRNTSRAAIKSLKLNLFNPKTAYIKHMLKLIDIKTIRKAKLRVAVDCLYGTSRGYLDYMLTRAGAKVRVLHNTINPSFGGWGPDPNKKNLTKLRKLVIKTRSHLGLATDGDGDRFGIIDSDGSYIPANQVLSLILDHLIKTRPHKGGIVRSITTTHLLDAIAEKSGRPVYEVPVGFKYVGSTLMKKDAIMGGEESGGMSIYGHIPEKDGVLACLLIAELVAYNRKSLKAILKGLQSEYGSFYNKRIDVKVTPEKKDAILTRFKKHPLDKFAGLKVTKYLKLKGNNFKFILADGSWIIIRPSGTEPIIRCYMETNSQKRFTILKNALTKLA